MVETRRSSASSKRPLNSPLPTRKRSKKAESSSSNSLPIEEVNQLGPESREPEVGSVDQPCVDAALPSGLALPENSPSVKAEGVSGKLEDGEEAQPVHGAVKQLEKRILKTDKPAGGQLISPSSQKYHRLKAVNPDSETLEDTASSDDELFSQGASSWNQKGKVCGLGSSEHTFYDRPSSPCSQSTSSSQIRQLQQRIDALQEEMNRLSQHLRALQEMAVRLGFLSHFPAPHSPPPPPCPF